MSGREFIDTNVPICAGDAQDLRKRRQIRDLIRGPMENRRGVVSLHVLHSEDVSSGQRIESLAIDNPFVVPYGS